MQNDLQHQQYHHGVDQAQARGENARGKLRQPWLAKIGENASGAEAQQRNRNGKKGKVIEDTTENKRVSASSSNRAAKLVRPKPVRRTRSGTSEEEEAGAKAWMVADINE